MPRRISFVFDAKSEEDRFFALLGKMQKHISDSEASIRNSLLDKSNFQISDVSTFTTQMRDALTELEALVRD